MTNPKGGVFERLMADFFRDRWSKYVDRRVKTGAADKGDIANFYVGDHLLALECKNLKSYDLAGAITEAETEARNAGALCGIAVIKRKGKGQAKDQFVVMTAESFIKILEAK